MHVAIMKWHQQPGTTAAVAAAAAAAAERGLGWARVATTAIPSALCSGLNGEAIPVSSRHHRSKMPSSNSLY